MSPRPILTGGINATCNPCPLGRYADVSQQVECKICQEGKTTYDTGKLSCVKDTCGAGEGLQTMRPIQKFVRSVIPVYLPGGKKYNMYKVSFSANYLTSSAGGATSAGE